MKRLVSLLPLVLLAACSKDPPATPEATETASASASASESPAATPSAAARTSTYTALKDCSVVESNEEEDWSVSRCAGPGGWSLQVDYGDARDDAQLLHKGKPAQPLNLGALTGGAFNALGDTVEWRGADRAKPSAMILRNSVSEDPEDSSKTTASLLVVDLTQGCVVAQVRPQAGQNEAARAVADGPRQPCLKGGR
jgi:hypothetical protein